MSRSSERLSLPWQQQYSFEPDNQVSMVKQALQEKEGIQASTRACSTYSPRFPCGWDVYLRQPLRPNIEWNPYCTEQAKITVLETRDNPDDGPCYVCFLGSQEGGRLWSFARGIADVCFLRENNLDGIYLDKVNPSPLPR